MSDQEEYGAGETASETGETTGPEDIEQTATETWQEVEQTATETWQEVEQTADETWQEVEQTADETWQWASGEGGQYEGGGGESGGGGASWGYGEEGSGPGDAGVPGGTPEPVPCGEGPCPICFMQRQTSSPCILWWGHEGDHQCGYGDWFGVGAEDLPRDPIVPLCRDRCPTCQADPNPDAFKGECVRTLGHDGAHSYSCLHS